MARDRYWFWNGDKAVPTTLREADRDFSHLDAGTDEMFVVRATSLEEAEQGARDWLANRAEEATETVPDHCGLEERMSKRSGWSDSYMMLWVRL